MFDYEIPNLVDYYSDIVNFFIIIMVIIYSYEKKFLDKGLSIYLFLSSITCFIFNYLIFDWTFFPDQNKYRLISSSIREEIFFGYSPDNAPSKVQYFTGLFYSIVPIPFIETINSLSFSNKLLFTIFIVFVSYKKLIPKNYYVFFVFFPSVLLYSSLSLKDNLVLILVLLIIYFTIFNYLLRALLLSLILLTIKIPTGSLVLVFYLLYIYFFSFKEKYFKSKLFFVLIFVLFITILLLDTILYRVNFHSFTFWEQGGYVGDFKEILSLTELILAIVINAFSAFFLPINYDGSVLKLLLMIENLMFLLILIVLFKKYYLILLNKFNFWFLYLVCSYSVFNIIVSNPGTFARYKYPFTVSLVFAIFCELKKKKYKNK